ncbi:hypothetical protein EXS65_02305 [Candidatus Peribacteria bacterium]|nr:hypothetical protein [Candidatus Peribacteria bacterium]
MEKDSLMIELPVLSERERWGLDYADAVTKQCRLGRVPADIEAGLRRYAFKFLSGTQLVPEDEENILKYIQQVIDDGGFPGGIGKD